MMVYVHSGGQSRIVERDVDYKAYTLFVYNFMKYIEWPESAIQGNFVVGVVGESPIIKEFQALAKTKKIKGHMIVVVKIQHAEEALQCQLVYIPSSKSTILKTIDEKTSGKAVLFVGEREGLAKKGAAFSFFTDEDDMLRFEVNKKAIEKRNLKVPSSLINLGEKVG